MLTDIVAFSPPIIVVLSIRIVWLGSGTSEFVTVNVPVIAVNEYPNVEDTVPLNEKILSVKIPSMAVPTV